MNTHDNILDNLEHYHAKDFAKYIRQGIITMDELQEEGLAKGTQDEIAKLLDEKKEDNDWQTACNSNTETSYQKYLDDYPHGKYRSNAWDAINAIRNTASAASKANEVETTWSNVNKTDVDELQHFIDSFPSSPHRLEARRILNRLSGTKGLTGVQKIQRIISREDPDEVPSHIETLILNQEAEEDDLIQLFQADHNILPATVVSMLDGIIDFHALEEAGIEKAFIEKLRATDDISFDLDTDVLPLSRIPDGFTEIYFWGVPASGKTCAVGSIMSTMTNGVGVKSVMPHTDSQGAKYMMPLASSFRKDQVCILPPRTKVEETFEMRYTITDDSNKEHGIAFIDLSGELFECMHISRTGGALSPKQNNALKVLNNILVNNRSQNPKIHFFVIEYGSENKRYKGLSQNELLLSCLNYLDDKSILKDNTIGAYLIITKADKAGDDNIGNYIDTHYSGFFNGLVQRMTKWGINTRKGKSQVKRFPFSIGDVCFQNWCLYDPEWTSYIIDEIKERSYGVETGFIGKFKSVTRK